MLRSRVYDVTLSDDVIGPFFKVMFPLHLVDLVSDSFFLSRLRDWKNPSDSCIFRQTFVQNEENRLRLKSSPRRGLNCGTLEAKILRSDHFTTRLAGPG